MDRREFVGRHHFAPRRVQHMKFDAPDVVSSGWLRQDDQGLRRRRLRKRCDFLDAEANRRLRCERPGQAERSENDASQ